MAKWLYIIVPLVLGGVAFAVMEPAHWAGVRQGLIPALALLGAAVLVRLARGMPVSDTSYFEVAEMRRLSTAVLKVYGSLIFLFSVIIVSILVLVFIEVVLAAIGGFEWVGAVTRGYLQQFVSGILMALVTYALGRTVALVRGDYALVKLQAKVMEQAVERRHADHQRENMERAENAKPFQPRSGYGKLHH